MSFVAVAIGSAAVIGGVATVTSGNKAAKAATQAADASVAESRRQYDQTRDDFAPAREIGTSALRKLAGLYGVGGGTSADTDWDAYVSADPAAERDWRMYHSGGQAVPDGNGGWITPDSMSKAEYGQYHWKNDGGKRDLAPYQISGGNAGGFTASPGYQFRLDEGIKAVERSAAARGLLGSGGTIKAIQRYGEGLAASEYDSYANRLAAMAGVGQSATSSTAAAGAQSSQGIQQAYMNAGNAKASAYQNTGTAIGNMAGNLAGAYVYGQGMKTPTPMGAGTGTWV